MNFLNSLMLEVRRQKIATPAFLLTLLAMIMLPLPPAVLDVLIERCRRTDSWPSRVGSVHGWGMAVKAIQSCVAMSARRRGVPRWAR